jgi:quercetin dioxygenase-like cupin family protein
MPTRAVINSIATGPKFVLVGDVYTLLLSGEQTRNRFALIHSTVSPGFGPPPHIHTREDETFYVLSGEVTYYLGETPHLLRAGSVLHIPRDVPHHFKNTGSTVAEFLVQVAPAGNFDRYLQAVGEPVPANYVPAPPTPEHIQKVLALGPDFGIQFV